MKESTGGKKVNISEKELRALVQAKLREIKEMDPPEEVAAAPKKGCPPGQTWDGEQCVDLNEGLEEAHNSPHPGQSPEEAHPGETCAEAHGGGALPENIEEQEDETLQEWKNNELNRLVLKRFNIINE